MEEARNLDKEALIVAVSAVFDTYSSCRDPLTVDRMYYTIIALDDLLGSEQVNTLVKAGGELPEEDASTPGTE